MKNTIIFDLDGTLIATMEGFADIAAELIHENFQMPLLEARQAYIDTSGIAFCKQLEVIFPKGDRNKSVAEEFEKRKLVHFFDEAPNPKVIEALKSLKNRGYALAISSNNFHDVVNKYAQQHFRDLFEVVLGFEEGFAKGLPHFERICDELDIYFENIIFVADSLSDFRLARECNIEFIGVRGIFSAQDFQKIDQDARVLENLWDLPLHLTN